jgi:2-oxoisovalerate dehydrogenase E2 component (dihydrolipoyl transacylase)
MGNFYLVSKDQILADVMTDKATVENPSHVAGRVVSLDVTVGHVVAVSTPIIHIEKQAVAKESPWQTTSNNIAKYPQQRCLPHLQHQAQPQLWQPANPAPTPSLSRQCAGEPGNSAST